MSKYTAANWNKPDDDFTQVFFQQLRSQIWFSEEISMLGDLPVWNELPQNVKDTYVRNLGVLTFLDTHQGNEGMNIIGRSIGDDYHQRKATLSFIEMTENAIHAKSYSSIFTTYLPTNTEIDAVFDWCENNDDLQAICDIIISIYKNLDRHNYAKQFNEKIDGKEVSELDFKIAQWKAMVASTYLETYLFYSGFYYPLWFYGQGKLMQAGEVINLIIRDESIHGLFVGTLSREIYDTFSDELQEELHGWAIKVLELLYKHQTRLMEALYDGVGLTHDVKVFVRYNANKALMNVGFEPYFDEEEVNPIVLNGLNTRTKEMDFFSMKGNGYQSMTAETVSEDDIASILSMESIAIPEPSEDEKSFIHKSEDEIINYLKESVIDSDIYSASRIKEVEDTLLEYLIKTLKRTHGTISNRHIIDFLEGSESDKLDTLLDLYNKDVEDVNINTENMKMVSWLIEYFGLNEVYVPNENRDDDDYDDKLTTDYEVTAPYRRLLLLILGDM